MTSNDNMCGDTWKRRKLLVVAREEGGGDLGARELFCSRNLWRGDKPDSTSDHSNHLEALSTACQCSPVTSPASKCGFNDHTKPIAPPMPSVP